MSDPDFLFHGVTFNPADTSVRRFTYEELDQELEGEGVFSWIDIQSADIHRLNEVLRRWEIDLILVNQFNEPEVLPRIVERSDCLAFYLYEIVEPERHLDTSREMTEIAFARMILILGRDFVITYHQVPLDGVDYVKETCVASFELAGKTPGFIAFLFLLRCLYDYAHLNLANDNFLDALHSGVEARMPHVELRAKIDLAGRNILILKKLTASLHIILMILVTKRNRFISDGARASFSEMLQTAVSTRAAIDSSRDLLDGIIGSIQSAAASRTSDIARVLTIVSAIILPLSLIAGIYGMNFDNMPELHHPWGYFLALGLMGLLALYLIVVFRRLGWIGRSRS
ncbi:MAG TPA: CorA family divalent cation transporter [Thermoanaerobaculia bacterium]|nr:CorA family divalent cation transporter [Thermoanaerobaculia bacterium]